MSFSRLRRRASIVALATMLAGLTLVGLYSHAVQKGILPSPVQPFVARTPPPTVIKPSLAPVPVSARTDARPVAVKAESASESVPPAQHSSPSLAAATDPERSSEASQAMKTPPSLISAQPTAIPAEPLAQPPAPSSSEPKPKGAPSLRVDGATEELARHWVTRTNARPVVRIHYDPSDMVGLLKLRRGVLVARQSSHDSVRELYLQNPDAAAPLFAPFTPSIATQFSSYALALDSAAEWTRLAQTLPLYFSGGNVTLAFVPDDGLATEIFRAVAVASRSVFGEATIPAGTTFEGALRLVGDQPQFALRDVRRGAQHLLTQSPAAKLDSWRGSADYIPESAVNAGNNQ